MTVVEFWEFDSRPENRDRAFDLIDGEVVEWPLPYHKHGVVCARLCWELGKYAERTRTGYVVGANAGIILGPDCVAGPDLAYFVGDSLDDDPLTGWSRNFPALVVEVRSPNDDIPPMTVKIRAYLNRGIVVWQVDYEERTVTVHRPNTAPAVVSESADLTGGDEMPGFSCKVAEFFRLPGDRPPAPPQPQPPVAP